MPETSIGDRAASAEFGRAGRLRAGCVGIRSAAEQARPVQLTG
jgi:hypothetical protein